MKKGNGELLGFVVCMPVFIFLLVLIISLTQIALAKEELEYVAYTSARSAVVAENFDDALTNAEAIVNEMARTSGYDNPSVEILINDVPVVRGSNVAWNKGVFIKVRVSFDVDAMVDFLDGPRSSSIVMMVERPALTGGGTP